MMPSSDMICMLFASSCTTVGTGDAAGGRDGTDCCGEDDGGRFDSLCDDRSAGGIDGRGDGLGGAGTVTNVIAGCTRNLTATLEPYSRERSDDVRGRSSVRIIASVLSALAGTTSSTQTMTVSEGTVGTIRMPECRSTGRSWLSAARAAVALASVALYVSFDPVAVAALDNGGRTAAVRRRW